MAFLTAWSGRQTMVAGMRDLVSRFIDIDYLNALGEHDSGSLAIDKQSHVLYLGCWLRNCRRSVTGLSGV